MTYLRMRWVSLVAAAVVVAVAGTGCSEITPLPAAPPAAAGPAGAAPRLGVGSARAAVPEKQAAVAAAALQWWYNGRSYLGAHWWQSAIALSTVVSYMEASGSRAYVSDLADTYHAFHNTVDFTRNYYDDEGWWVLVWAQAYGLTGDKRYLAEAKHIFSAMAEGWSSTCGGGVPWSKLHLYKNSITNLLFLDGAATLHNLIPGDHVYGAWALREWRWFRSTGLLNAHHLVLDGLSTDCAPTRHSVTWTYNQGVLISALVQLTQMTGHSKMLALANEVASAVIHSRKLSPGGILTEPCGTAGCSTDSDIFKGVLAQGLGVLAAVSPSRELTAYLSRNAASVWAYDREGRDFGLNWAGPFDSAGAARQSAALAILTARLAAIGD